MTSVNTSIFLGQMGGANATGDVNEIGICAVGSTAANGSNTATIGCPATTDFYAGNTGGANIHGATLQQTAEKSCSTGLTSDSSGNINGCVASDRRLKRGVEDLPGTDVLMRLRPRNYWWRDTKKRDASLHAGFIADEVKSVYSQGVVPAGTENGKAIYGVDPNAMVALAIKAIQEQQREIESLKAAIADLRKGRKL